MSQALPTVAALPQADPAPGLSPGSLRERCASGLRAAIEVVVLLLVCLSPWAYGAVHPGFEFLLDLGVGLVLLLWAVRMLLAGELTWKKCPLALCLAGLFLLALWQTTALPRPLVEQLSPKAGRLYRELLPAGREALPFGAGRGQVEPTPGSTLSLYPYATQGMAFRLLAVLLLFAAVRNNVASKSSLKRLAVVALANAVLLSLFALIQFFTSRPGLLYWQYPTLGMAYGPFINRNHFAFYVNVCFGLGLGLLLNRIAHRSGRRSASGQLGGGGRLRRLSEWLRSRSRILLDPVTLSLSFALVILLSSVLFCLSRGGYLALAGAALALLLVRLWRAPRRAGWLAAAAVGGLAAVLALWFGGSAITARLETLWKGQAHENRLPVWGLSLSAARDFPVWGTGFGTFRYVEPMYYTETMARPEPDEKGKAPEPITNGAYVHAHSEYLELLMEGGIAGLALGLLGIGLVYGLGLRGLGKHRGRTTNALMTGALFGFTTLVIHSFGEFGLHIPAITVLAAVLAAQICAVGAEVTRPATGETPVPPAATGGTPVPATTGEAPAVGPASRRSGAAPEYRVRLGGLAPLLGAAAVVALGFLLVGFGWRAHRVDRLRAAALLAGTSEEEDPKARIRLLQAAAAVAPLDAEVRAELGRALVGEFERRRAPFERKGTVAALGLALAAPGAGPPAAATGVWALGLEARRAFVRPEEAGLRRELLTPALRDYLQARDACPVLGTAHLGLAAFADELTRAGGQDDYLRRAQVLAPCSAETWYVSGVQGVIGRRPERAYADWRRSLELADTFLPQILSNSRPFLTPQEMVDKLIPGRPDMLVAAGSLLYPRPGASEKRVFLEKALACLRAREEPLRPDELRVKAAAHKGLGQTEEALATYRALVKQEPWDGDYRYEMAAYLYEVDRLEECRREVLTVLAQEPNHGLARELQVNVQYEIVRRRWKR